MEKVICHWIPIRTLLFFTALPARQNGVENRDKVFYLECLFSGLENRQYVPLGCFRDRKDDKALPIQVENFRGNGINWKDMSQTVKRCAIATAKKYPKLEVFGLQFYGECYSGYNGLETYSKHGQVPYSDDINTYCWSGVGGPGFNFVYKFEKYNGEILSIKRIYFQ